MGWFYGPLWVLVVPGKASPIELRSSPQIMIIQVLQEEVDACSFIPWTSVAAVESNCEASISFDSSCYSRSSSRPLKYHTQMHGSIASLRGS
ncbi:hypothetical protein EDD85DRAFT_841683 [Armillaria nabsnona]|nr:hypothetical protein EDD85DRAFT_841683 [Armillaria nabsnona]